MTMAEVGFRRVLQGGQVDIGPVRVGVTSARFDDRGVGLVKLAAIAGDRRTLALLSPGEWVDIGSGLRLLVEDTAPTAGTLGRHLVTIRILNDSHF